MRHLTTRTLDMTSTRRLVQAATLAYLLLKELGLALSFRPLILKFTALADPGHEVTGVLFVSLAQARDRAQLLIC